MCNLLLVSLLAMLLIGCRRGALARSLADLDSDSVEWTHATGTAKTFCYIVLPKDVAILIHSNI